MISREDIKRAIDSIAARDPEVGYALDEMLASRQIDVPPRPRDPAGTEDPSFLFAGDKVTVRRFLLFEQGPGAVEERLLLRYGEIARREELMRRGSPDDWRRTGMEIQEAGPVFLLEHLLDCEARRLEAGPESDSERIRELVALLRRIVAGKGETAIPWDEQDPAVFYQGVVDIDTPAQFVRFPFCREALLQVADLNLEFFNLRFLLECLTRGVGENLFACVVRRRIAGMVLVGEKKGRAGGQLEIQCISTVAGRPADVGGEPPTRGAGAMLAAGVWLLQKQYEPGRSAVVLTSEIAAQRFYESLGFSRRRTSEYVLREPRGHLLRNLVAMTNHLPGPERSIVAELARLLQRQARAFARADLDGASEAERLEAALLFEECFRSRAHPDFALAAAEMLVKHGQGKPFCERLLRSAAEYGLVRPRSGPGRDAPAVLVVLDDRFAGHLESVLHFESGARIRAVQAVLHDPSVAGLVRKVPPRRATVEELSWVHTGGHIRRIAETAGRPFTQLEGDTEATAESYDIARLAVGGVFNLLDEIMAGRGSRGFAFVRPPGHHAEPDRAMGFCLFNNIALGARYLSVRHGLDRVMIIDIDVHHGNGTQKAFYDTAEVLYVSLHRFPSYPFTGDAKEVGEGPGEGYTVNVPLDKRRKDADLVRILRSLLFPIADQYRPEMILVSLGFDFYTHDPMSDMCVTPEGYAHCTGLLLELAERVSEGRVAFVMEGGYSLRGIRECGLLVMQELCGLAPGGERRGRIRARPPDGIAELREVLEVQRKYWKI